MAGRVTRKMAPVLRLLYDQMPDPKWVVSMGDCASCGGIFNNYAIVQGVDEIMPVDVPQVDGSVRTVDTDQSVRSDATAEGMAQFVTHSSNPPDRVFLCGVLTDQPEEVIDLITGSDEAYGMFQLYSGAIATSGDAHRYLIKDDVRYSHILNPVTGWSVIDAPHTVSVAAATCVEAGMMSTLAMLQGGRAEEFLKIQEVDYWIV